MEMMTMTDIAVTATNVKKGSGAKVVIKYALEAITAGQSVYQSTTDATKVGKHDADGAAPLNTLYGVALNGASIDQPVVVQYDGEINIGGTVAVGTVYLGSDTAGGIRPDADRNTGDTVSILGVGKTVTTIQLDIKNTGIVSA
jgi:hypothetical protein